MIGGLFLGQFAFLASGAAPPVYTAPPFDNTIVAIRRRKVRNR